MLSSPGSVLVVVSKAPSRLEIGLAPLAGDRPPQAQFNLELLAAGAVPPAELARPSQDESAPQPSRSGNLRVVAHVSRIGDLTVDEGAWIGGPNAPSPIEALGVTSLASDLTVSAEFVNTMSPNQWVACPTSEFIGTRQQASPLLGLKLKLEGPKSDRFRLNAEALFLGNPMATASGQQVTMVSETGRDPMIGLRVWLSEVAKQNVQDKAGVASRVRVFRAN